MVTYKKLNKAINVIEKYCKEHNLNGHHFKRKVLIDSLKYYSELEQANAHEYSRQFIKN